MLFHWGIPLAGLRAPHRLVRGMCCLAPGLCNATFLEYKCSAKALDFAGASADPSPRSCIEHYCRALPVDVWEDRLRHRRLNADTLALLLGPLVPLVSGGGVGTDEITSKRGC